MYKKEVAEYYETELSWIWHDDDGLCCDLDFYLYCHQNTLHDFYGGNAFSSFSSLSLIEICGDRGAYASFCVSCACFHCYFCCYLGCDGAYAFVFYHCRSYPCCGSEFVFARDFSSGCGCYSAVLLVATVCLIARLVRSEFYKRILQTCARVRVTNNFSFGILIKTGEDKFKIFIIGEWIEFAYEQDVFRSLNLCGRVVSSACILTGTVSSGGRS
ncbi:hypothetical protein ACHAW6_004550 [Cyclotella cf. meneghiniana]